MKRILWASVLMWTWGVVYAESPETPAITPEQVKRGSGLYAQHCAPCHGVRMQDPDAFDLRKFPRDGHARFVRSVTHGKNSMPPWGGLLQPDEIASLWAYVVRGEKN
jgi:mono/diheme cytochrome c family protein